MQQILATTNPVLVSFAMAVLRDAGVEAFLADENIAFTEGGIGAFPRRILVPAHYVPIARRALSDAGLARELSMTDANE